MRSRALHQLPRPVEDDLRRIGALIRRGRADRGLTQDSLAKHLQISCTTVRAAEQGDPSVTSGILMSLLWMIGINRVADSLADKTQGA
jgi:ribosome-binding protein aMBF1 (putative translation factor)